MEDRRTICPPSSGSQYPLAPVLGGRAEDAFRPSMIGARGDLRVFWSNGRVGTIHDAGPGPVVLADDRQSSTRSPPKSRRHD